MEYNEKITIRVSQDIKTKIAYDIKLFELFKKNRSPLDKDPLNTNRFLSLLIEGYYDSYDQENKEIYDSVRRILKEHNVKDHDAGVAADRILNAALISRSGNKKEKKPVTLSLKVTKKTDPIIQNIQEDINAQGSQLSVREYIYRMLISYFNKAVWERERIIFSENCCKIEEAIKNGRRLRFSLIWDENRIHDVIPYRLADGMYGMLNYLVCAEKNPKTGEMEVRSYRLSRINDLKDTYNTEQMSSKTEELCSLTAENSPQYAVNSHELIYVKLNDEGIRLYNRIYLDRPVIVDDMEHEGGFFYFRCSQDQAFNYFRKFGNGSAVIISPDTLVQRMKDFHRSSLAAYENYSQRP